MTTTTPKTRKRSAKIALRIEEALARSMDLNTPVKERLKAMAFILSKTKQKPPQARVVTWEIEAVPPGSTGATQDS